MTEKEIEDAKFIQEQEILYLKDDIENGRGSDFERGRRFLRIGKKDG